MYKNDSRPIPYVVDPHTQISAVETALMLLRMQEKKLTTKNILKLAKLPDWASPARFAAMVKQYARGYGLDRAIDTAYWRGTRDRWFSKNNAKEYETGSEEYFAYYDGWTDVDYMMDYLSPTTNLDWPENAYKA